MQIRDPQRKNNYTSQQYKVGFTSAIICIIGPEFFFVPFVSLICKSGISISAVIGDDFYKIKDGFRNFYED